MENCKSFYVGSTVGSNIFSSSDPLKKKKKKKQIAAASLITSYRLDSHNLFTPDRSFC